MDIQIQSSAQHNQLSLVQFSTESRNTLPFITGSQAISEKKLEVREISDSGSVNNIVVLNFSDQYVFFSDGDMLVGAKQNRVINTSILLLPDSKTIIPVSCIEAGRWNARSGNFKFSKFHAPSSMRSEKAKIINLNLKNKKGFYADQREIWNHVSSSEKEYGMHSSTSDFTKVYESIEEKIEKILSRFPLSKEANGLAFYTGHELQSLEIFNRTDVYENYFQRLVRGFAMDVVQLPEKEIAGLDAEVRFKTLDFMDNYEKLEFEVYKGVAAGEERRFENKETTGFELNYRGHLIHFTVFSKNRMSSQI